MKIRYRKVFIDEDPIQPEPQEPCPECRKRCVESTMRYMFINYDLAVYKCSGLNCLYPYENFKYKNYKDRTVYQLEVIKVTQNDSHLPTGSMMMMGDDFSSEFSPFGVSADDRPYSYQSQPVDTAFLDTDETKLQKKKDAIEKLESELHDLLSEHVDLGDPVKAQTTKIKFEMLTPSSSPTISTSEPEPPKRRKLLKAYEFLERTLGTKAEKQSGETDEPFKVPALPSDHQAISTPRRHHHHHHSHHHHKSPKSQYKDYKLPKEVRSPVKAQQPAMFLKHIERQQVLLTDLSPVPVPIKIEVLSGLSLMEYRHPNATMVTASQFSNLSLDLSRPMNCS